LKYLEEGEDSPVKMERHSSIRTEAEMIAAIVAGDTQLYHDLIRPHERSVYMMALSFVKNEADAEDIAQEAFLKAFRNLSTFREESKFSTWLISIALNEARSRLRRETIVRMESLDDPPDDGGRVSPALLRDWREIPSEAVERRETRQMLQEAVISLPTIYRQVFQLRDVDELSVRETAEALGISVPSVKVRLHRARMMLQKQLVPLLKSVSPGPKRRWLPWL
jgi:RNA polymerase sigma-70 factor (ECF subfamily)